MNPILPVSAAFAAALGVAAHGPFSFVCLAIAILLAVIALGRYFATFAPPDPWRELRRERRRGRSHR